MVKKSILLLSVASALTLNVNAQRCATDEQHRDYISVHPEIAEIQADLDAQIKHGMMYLGDYLSGVQSKTTSNSPRYDFLQDSIYNAVVAEKLYIPVVVHVIHDYGNEYIADNTIYHMMDVVNEVYLGQNTAELNSVLAAFKPYIGKPNIEFRLATKDPNGRPTKGIVRHRSYLTNGGDDQAKFDIWAPNRYLNIFLERKIGRQQTGGTVLAYATLPAGAAGFPYSDGVISGYQYTDFENTIQHEIGHYLNLYHPWNSSQGTAGASCGDDEVDDTPPTKGHFSTCPINDSACANGYMKSYTYLDLNGNQQTAIEDYPDTTNVENIMDYSSCTKMFTKQQVLRMREALRSTVANRSNLVSASNLTATGALLPRLDLKPIPDFSVEKGQNTSVQNTERSYFLCKNGGASFTFIDRSWGDTVTNVNWSFSNSATPANTTSAAGGVVNVKFGEPGWATITQTVTGNNSGDTTASKTAVYVADNSNPIDASGSPYYQEFDPTSQDLDKWPMFNYYDNQTKWSITPATGYYDKYCLVYNGFDKRGFPNNLVGDATGDYDDIYTPAFNLSTFSGSCNLSFLTAGVFRTSNVDLMKDTFEVFISTDCGGKWDKLKTYTQGDIGNNGTYSQEYMPQWTGEWSLKNIDIPAAQRKDVVYFRFRFKPYGNPSLITRQGTGNNFYVDRINVNSFPTGVNTILAKDQNIALAPNPTTGSSFVVVNAGVNEVVKIAVADITGKIIYRTEEKMNSQVARIEIPASAISVKGVYMVHVATNNETKTEKLVVQ